MVKVMYNDQLVYKVVIWAAFGINVWKEKEALTLLQKPIPDNILTQLLREIQYLSSFNFHVF